MQKTIFSIEYKEVNYTTIINIFDLSGS